MTWAYMSNVMDGRVETTLEWQPMPMPLSFGTCVCGAFFPIRFLRRAAIVERALEMFRQGLLKRFLHLGHQVALHVPHVLIPLVDQAAVLEDDAVDVEALCVALQPQASLAELLDAHQLVVVLVEQREQSPRLIRLYVHGLEVHDQRRVLE